MVPIGEHWYLQRALATLKAAVIEQNRQASVEGLLARHILSGDVWIDLSWKVECSPAWVATEYQPTNLECVAALAFSMWERFTPDYSPALVDGLERVTGRDP